MNTERSWALGPGALLVIVATGCGGDNSTSDGGDGPVPVTGDWFRPGLEATWQWQLSGEINASYDVDIYDIDLFEASDEAIATLKAEGRRVICYYSAGSSEDWRPDFDEFGDADMGEPLDGWEGERWLDVRSANVMAINLARLDLASQRGCDGVEPDNVDGADNETGFALTHDDQLAFNRAIADAAHERNLAIALKNDGAQTDELVAYMDFVVNEECFQYGECEDWAIFVEASKPVFNAEYPGDEAAAEALADDLCARSEAMGFHTLMLPLDLDDAWRVSCDR